MSTVEHPLTILRFPNVRLRESEGHYLRGYIANQFGHLSTLLHNHVGTEGGLRHSYPLVQYKVIRGTGTIIGIGEGADLVSRIGAEIKELDIDGRIVPVHEVDLQQGPAKFGVTSDLNYYKFLTYWIALKQERYREFRQMREDERPALLERTLVGNILSCFKGLDFRVSERIQLTISSYQTQGVNFKNERLIGFECSFYSNALIPEYLGLGKASARGFGVIGLGSPGDTTMRHTRRQGSLPGERTANKNFRSRKNRT